MAKVASIITTKRGGTFYSTYDPERKPTFETRRVAKGTKLADVRTR